MIQRLTKGQYRKPKDLKFNEIIFIQKGFFHHFVNLDSLTGKIQTNS